MSSKLPVALQLYSVRKDCEKDLPGVLKQLAKIGYDGVEFAGYYGYGAADLKRMLDDVGLKVAGTHIRLDQLLEPNLAGTIEFNRTIGNSFLIVPGLASEHTSSVAAWIKTAGVFSRIAQALRPHGMRTGYHNHHTEFTPLEGQVPWDIFATHTDKDVVLQLDIGNAMHGGADALEYLRKYPGRALTIHLKEYAKGYNKALIGEGDANWEEVFKFCESQGGTQWYIVEQESYALPPLECVDKCLRNIRKMGR